MGIIASKVCCYKSSTTKNKEQSFNNLPKKELKTSLANTKPTDAYKEKAEPLIIHTYESTAAITVKDKDFNESTYQSSTSFSSPSFSSGSYTPVSASKSTPPIQIFKPRSDQDILNLIAFTEEHQENTNVFEQLLKKVDVEDFFSDYPNKRFPLIEFIAKKLKKKPTLKTVYKIFLSEMRQRINTKVYNTEEYQLLEKRFDLERLAKIIAVEQNYL